VASEPRAVEHVGPEDEQAGDDEHHVRDAAVLVADVGDRQHADGEPGDAQQEDGVRGAHEPRAGALRPLPEQHRRVQHDGRDGEDPRGGRRQEVVGEADEEAVLDDDGALVADEQQDGPVPGQQARQRDHEGGHSELRDDHAVQQADADAGAESQHQRRAGGEHVVVVGERQQGDDHARHAADEADREVDLPQQQHEDDPHADGRERGRLDDEVDEVPGGEKVRVLRLEDDRDDD
jgi:hypothetical protein